MFGMTKPVLFLFYKRPYETLRVFKEIEKYKPKKLFLSSDGSNNYVEYKLIMNLRNEVLKRITWDCHVETKFNETNLGLAKGVSSAITWFFDNVEDGIILEDDCVPNKEFFLFCETMLNKYKNNKDIFMVSGNNFINNKYVSNDSYFFSKYAHIWGWASWRDKWENYSLNIEDVEFEYDSMKEMYFWENWFKDIRLNHLLTWDVQWLHAIWKNKGLIIYPNKNLVCNIGFGSNATNTKKTPKFLLNQKWEKLSFPLKHPSKITRNVEADKITFKTWFDKGFKVFIPNTILRELKKWV